MEGKPTVFTVESQFFSWMVPVRDMTTVRAGFRRVIRIDLDRKATRQSCFVRHKTTQFGKGPRRLLTAVLCSLWSFEAVFGKTDRTEF
jgi:hypothetical protein